jgi:hypothetical protein
VTLGGDVPLPDTGSTGDPLVIGIDEFFQLCIGDDAFRQEAAGADDARVSQSRIPQRNEKLSAIRP